MSYQVEILIEWAKLRTPIESLVGYDSSFTSVLRAHWQNSERKDGEDLARMVAAEGVKQRTHKAVQNRYNFNRVRQHLETLPDSETKIIYLIEIKTEYLQVGAVSNSESKRFDQKCELEKAKLERLVEIPLPSRLMALPQKDQAVQEKAATTQLGLSEEEYLILAVAAAKAIGLRGNKLTDERMAEEMDCSRRTALKYRIKYSNAFNTSVRSEYEEGLKEFASKRNKT
jgi:hypothetical protein